MHNKHFGCIVLCIVAALFFTVYLGENIKERENREERELINDTAKVNEAYRTYEKVSLQLLSEETEVQELAEGVLEMKDKFERISLYVNDAERILDRLEYKRTDVSDLREILENIKNECESPTN